MSASEQDAHSFPYRAIGGDVYRPVIQVELRYGNKESIAYEALVDSGADFCVFDCEMADALGIKDLQSGNAYHIDGMREDEATGYEHTVTLAVGGDEFSADVVFVDREMNDDYGVLGQKGFFDKFIVTFNLNAKSVVLSRER